MKRLINDPRNVVRELLEGLIDSDPGLALLTDETVVLRSDIPDDPADRPVAVISGGGSGHEPAHAGFVGHGMLAAAVAGDVFTSPSVDSVYRTIRAVAGPQGALLIVKNYTGDRLNFGLAAELARAEGVPTELVLVADDVALRDNLSREHSRGIAGTVLVHKIAGAAASQGRPLEEVAKLASEAAHSLATMGIALGSCVVPTARTPGFELGEEEIEFGLGIHGEKGARKARLMQADAIVDHILDTLLANVATSYDGFGLLVNGLGGTPPMELLIVTRRALAQLRARGLHIELVWTGEFMTALEMPGCSISLLPLDATRRELLTAPTAVRIWPRSAEVPTTRKVVTAPVPCLTHLADTPPGPDTLMLRDVAEAIANSLEACEAKLTELDAAAGDGDLGASMVRGAKAIRSLPDAAFLSPRNFCIAAGDTLRRAIAGSSGPFYATALLRAGQVLPEGQAHATDWAQAFAAAHMAVTDIGDAKPGDRTMVDALAPASDAFSAAVARGLPAADALRDAVNAANKGAEDTAQMRPKFGRAAYLGERALGTPDGGAVAVAIWLTALSETLEELETVK